MWFARLFGGRRDNGADDELPTAVAPSRPVVNSSAATAERTPAIQNPVKPAAKKGFDPYNSGSFERRNAWERVNRR